MTVPYAVIKTKRTSVLGELECIKSKVVPGQLLTWQHNDLRQRDDL